MIFKFLKDTEALKVLYVLIVIINESDHPLYSLLLRMD